MKLYAFCPISTEQINERVARINAVFTILILILFVTTGNWFVPAFLAIDFLIRSGNLSKFSPVGYSSRSIVKFLSVKELFINAGPKLFAARIGFAFSLLILAATGFDLQYLAIGATGILMFFSFMEAVFGFCVACEIYPFLCRFLYNREF